MKNQEISKIFNEIADILEIKSDNPFRIRAYRRAALNIEGLAKNIDDMPDDELVKIPGVGKDLAAKVAEYIKTGKIAVYEELKQEIPPIVLTLETVPGLGPKTAMLLYEKLRIDSLDELARLAEEHKLAGLPGIKAKTEENILRGIGMLRRGRERQPLGKVLPLALNIVDQLKTKAPIARLDIAGSIRRWKDTIKDIDILATSDNPEEVMHVFVHLPQVKNILMHGSTKSSVVISEGLQVDLRVVEKDSYGAALGYFTGGKEHNIRLREMAVKKGLTINEYGVFRVRDNMKLGGEDEKDVYEILGMQFVPPELREDRGEIEAAIAHRLPELIVAGDIKGDLHVHSKWSDGSHTFRQLVDAAMECDYSYFALTDHSQGLGVAHGLTVDRLLEQVKEVDSLNKKLKKFRILKGTEVDIRSDGSLDFPDNILHELDIVVASIHSGFKQTKEQLTSRMVAAMQNPYVSIIGHPTGRLIGEREAYEIDMEKILKVAQETGTALEINAYPLRLDLNDIYAKKARDMGIPIVICTDTHVSSQFNFMSYGVSIARRSWLEKNDVANTRQVNQLLKILKPFGKRQPSEVTNRKTTDK
ncbi:MAG TPA: DNA polymerase/3'-5' exonuclease PolX [Dissulfurispiraceae bacterium]|nr:DNA polymerase/3'-5' exonuclease PolX [Dissulfurispiraceae bacterium]